MTATLVTENRAGERPGIANVDDIIRKCTFEVSSLEELPVEAINTAVDDCSLACIRGLFSRDEVRAAVNRVKDHFDPSLDRPGIGETAEDIMQNFQKLAVGGQMSGWDYRPRFVRVMYTPLWAEDVFGVHDLFRRFSQARNVIQGYPKDHAIEGVTDGLWTAARLQHYPTGGGFFAAHRDVVLERVTEDVGLRKFTQFLLLLTSRGEDYETGGGYIEIDGEKLLFEEYFKGGDIVMYSGTNVHGVAEVDPHRKTVFDRMEGRLVALASVYKDMRGEGTGYKGYEKLKQS